MNLDRALCTLREERPSPEATARLRAALRSPLSKERGSRLTRPLALTMITAALSLVVFYPRAKSGSAWAQTLAATLAAPASHSVSRSVNGKKGMEEWRSGVKRAHVLYFRDGKPGMEWRDDGRQLYNFGAMFADPASSNSRQWGLLSKSYGTAGILYELPYGSPETILKSPGIEVLGHDAATADRPERYRLRVPGAFRQMPKRTLTAELDASGRIHRLQWKNHKESTTIEYPERLPSSVFEPHPQAIPGVDVIDIVAQKKTVERDLRRGLGKQGPITLRLAMMDGDGTMWVFWTGAPPDMKMSHPVRIPGVRSTRYATKAAFASDGKLGAYEKMVPNASGERLGGMAFTPQTKVGPKVDLDVPYPGGVARFRGFRFFGSG